MTLHSVYVCLERPSGALPPDSCRETLVWWSFRGEKHVPWLIFDVETILHGSTSEHTLSQHVCAYTGDTSLSGGAFTSRIFVQDGAFVFVEGLWSTRVPRP